MHIIFMAWLWWAEDVVSWSDKGVVYNTEVLHSSRIEAVIYVRGWPGHTDTQWHLRLQHLVCMYVCMCVCTAVGAPSVVGCEWKVYTWLQPRRFAWYIPIDRHYLGAISHTLDRSTSARGQSWGCEIKRFHSDIGENLRTSVRFCMYTINTHHQVRELLILVSGEP